MLFLEYKFFDWFTDQVFHQMNPIFVFFLRHVVYSLFGNVVVADIEIQPFFDLWKNAYLENE